MPKTPAPELPVLHCPAPADWAAWLDANAAASPGVWLRIGKKGGLPSVTYPEALDEALCHGWIDGQKKTFDDVSFLQKFTPRRSRSVWSKINRGKVEALEAAGRMRPAGRAAVDAAKADGRWDAAYDSPAAATVPDDLRAALDASPAAARAFEGLDRVNRYAILHRVQTAVKPETRAKRIARFVEMLAAGGTIHPTA